MIGKGSFAKVYLAKKKENDNLYAIKAFSKNTILEQKKGLVFIFFSLLLKEKLSQWSDNYAIIVAQKCAQIVWNVRNSAFAVFGFNACDGRWFKLKS